MELTETDLDLILDALLAYERATDAQGRDLCNDLDHPDLDAELARLARRADALTTLAHRVENALDRIREDRAARAGQRWP